MEEQERSMSTTQESDSQAVLNSVLTGKPLDPEVRQRVEERSKRVQANMKVTRDVVVETLRESRDEQ
jgi:hypothetical protein